MSVLQATGISVSFGGVVVPRDEAVITAYLGSVASEVANGA
jgi:hypothetical protein